MTRRPGRGHDVAEASAPSRQPGALSAADTPPSCDKFFAQMRFHDHTDMQLSIKKLGADCL